MNLDPATIAELQKRGAVVGPTAGELLTKNAPPWTGRLELFVSGLIVVSEANKRNHHMARHRRKKQQQAILESALTLQPKPPKDEPIRVTLTRDHAARGKRMDVDNLAGSMKHCQDQVAKWLGRDDGDLTIQWQYGQRRAPIAGLEIVIERMT